MVAGLKRYSLLYRMQLRNFGKNIIQFLAVILISTLAITFYIGLMANADSISDRFNKTMEIGNVADIYITTSEYDSSDLNMIKDLLSSEDEIEGRIYLPGFAGTKESYIVITDGTPKLSTFYNVNNGEYECEDGFVYLDNTLVSDDRYDLLQRGKKNVGDDISFHFSLAQLGIEDKAEVLSSPGLLKDGMTGLVNNGTFSIKMTITGSMHHPENVLSANYNRCVSSISYSMFRKALIETIDKQYNEIGKATIRNTLIQAFGFDIYTSEHLTCFNQYLVKVKNRENIAAITETLNRRFNEENRSATIVRLEDMPFYMTVANDVKQARTFTYVFPLFFFMVAALIVMTTISQLIIKDRMQIGTLKAIGFKKREILFNYISLMSGLSIIGIIIGCTFGPLLVPTIMDKKYSTLYDLVERHYVFPWLSALIIVFAFLALTIIVTFLGSYGEIRLPPSESMKPKVPKLNTLINDRKKTGSITLSIRMAIRNIRCDLTRSAMVIIGVLGCTCLLLCGFGMEDTIYHGIENDRSIFLVGDYRLNLSIRYSEEEALKQIEEIEEIEYVEFYKVVTLTFTNEEKTLTNDNDIYVLSKEDSLFGLDVPKEGALVSKSIADSLKLKKGDDIYFTYGGQSGSIEIADVFDSFYYNSVVISPTASIVNEYSFLSNGYNRAWLTVKKGADIAQLDKKLYSRSSIFTFVIKSSALYKYIKNSMQAFLTITTTFKIFGLFLALLTLFNLALLNMNQRRRDIATMKILGFRKREMALALLVESMSLSTIGIGIGMLLGYPFMVFVLKSNEVSIINYIYKINPSSYIYTLVLTFFVALFINLIFALRTKRIDMAEITRSRY